MNTQGYEFKGMKINGILSIFITLLMIAGAVCSFYLASFGNIIFVFLGIALILLFVLSLFGFLLLEPNETSVLLFFGKYKGYINQNGFYWVNPFFSKKKVSYRVRNLDLNPIKVNDKVGNPIMIGSVIVWKLKDSYKALFDIDAETIASKSAVTEKGVSIVPKVNRRMDAFESFVRIQSDAALREVAGLYAYDNNTTDSHDTVTLRSQGQEVSDRLKQELNERLEVSGLEIQEARINYLAYAPEIAAVMLRRQQAEAIIAARERIVEGAVSMVKMALEKLDNEHIVELDEDKKAAMVSNLLVVLCSEDSTQPIVNAGTLHK